MDAFATLEPAYAKEEDSRQRTAGSLIINRMAISATIQNMAAKATAFSCAQKLGSLGNRFYRAHSEKMPPQDYQIKGLMRTKIWQPKQPLFRVPKN